MRRPIHDVAISLVLLLAVVACFLNSRDAQEANRRADAMATALVAAEIRIVVTHRQAIGWCAPVDALDWCADELDKLRRDLLVCRDDGQRGLDAYVRAATDLERCSHASGWRP